MEKKQKRKVVVDTNLLVSFVYSRFNSPLTFLLQLEGIELVFSKELMTELKDVLQRPKFAKKIESVSGFQFLKLLQQSVKFYSVKKVVSVGPDSEDYFLFSLTNTAKADYLITGDKELLALKNTDRL